MTKTEELELAAGTYTIYVETYDKAGNKAETEKKTITLGHNSVYGGTKAVHTKCSVCGTTLSSTHSFGNWYTYSSASCTSSGTDRRKCACGYYESRSTSSLGHSPGSGPTCTSAQTCTRCGTTLKSALGHDKEYGVRRVKSDESFYYTTRCKRCGKEGI